MKLLTMTAAALVASAGCGQHSGNLWKGICCRTAALERPRRVFRPPEGEGGAGKAQKRAIGPEFGDFRPFRGHGRPVSAFLRPG